jgi:hypothetical protein
MDIPTTRILPMDLRDMPDDVNRPQYLNMSNMKLLSLVNIVPQDIASSVATIASMYKK